MRVLLACVALLGAASCVAPPPPTQTAPPAPAVAAAPPPSEPVIIPPGQFWPGPLAWLFNPWAFRTPPVARLTLSNFALPDARVEALVTPFPDCVPREGTAMTDFVLPLNGTRIIEAVPGSDVCWRRAVPAGAAKTANALAGSGWTDWNRVYLSAGTSVDSQL